VNRSRASIRSIPWVSWAAILWSLVFGGLHLYWAMGGSTGFADFSTPPNRILAVTRDALYMAITWGVVLACAVGVMAALAPFQTWSRPLPRWLLLTPLWIACGLLLVRGIGNPVQSALIMGGVISFDGLSGPEAQAWRQWMRMDAILFSPWFILGGLAFGATARSAIRHGSSSLRSALRTKPRSANSP
jgi:hypothetical protein